MQPNTLRTIDIKTFIDTFALRRRFHVSQDGEQIRECLRTPLHKDDENYFTTLDKATAFAHQQFTSQARENYEADKLRWDKPWARFTVFYHRALGLGKNDVNIDAFEATMNEHKAAQDQDLSSFIDNTLTITLLPEQIQSHQMLPVGTKVYWLRMDDILKGRKVTIDESEITGIYLRQRGFDEGSDTYVVSYVLPQNDQFFIHDDYHGDSDDELFYGSRNVRLFLTLEAAKQAVIDIFAQASLVCTTQDQEQTSQPVRALNDNTIPKEASHG